MLFAGHGVRDVAVHADGEHSREGLGVIERRMQVSSGRLQVPAEGHGRVLLVEEVLNGGFVQAKVDEFANGAVVDQREPEVLRKVESSRPRGIAGERRCVC